MCEAYAENAKHKKYVGDFKGSNHIFAAVVWESMEAINREGEVRAKSCTSLPSAKAASTARSVAANGPSSRATCNALWQSNC